MSVHPWPWINKLTVTFAAEIAQGHLVHLRTGEDACQAAGFGILRESAANGYTNRYFETSSPKGSAYRKMRSAMWRESPSNGWTTASSWPAWPPCCTPMQAVGRLPPH